MRGLLTENDAMAYLVNMAPRLVELHRVLKRTGSLYLHCDPTMSHYLKVLLDAIFGPEMFRNEIIWRRTGAHAPRGRRSPMVERLGRGERQLESHPVPVHAALKVVGFRRRVHSGCV